MTVHNARLACSLQEMQLQEAQKTRQHLTRVQHLGAPRPHSLSSPAITAYSSMHPAAAAETKSDPTCNPRTLGEESTKWACQIQELDTPSGCTLFARRATRIP